MSTVKYRFHILFCLLTFLQAGKLTSQNLHVEGNGLFTSPASTNVDIKNIDDNANALIRFGDNNTSEVSVGFNGNEDVFKISTAATLGVDDFTMSLNGRIGINSLPSDHRFLINHNSVAGTSAHLVLRESATNDFARLRFENAGLDDIWTIAGRATEGDALLNIFYNNGTDFANIMSFDGDLHRVGIHKTTPEAYLHIKQVSNSVPALLLQNDDQTGAEKWQILVNGNSDLEFQFEGVIRGTFSSATGAYTAFPPPATLNGKTVLNEKVLDQVLQLKPISYQRSENMQPTTTFDPHQVEDINPDWVVRSGDGERLGINSQDFLILAIRSIQEQQEYIDKQNQELSKWEKAEDELDTRIRELTAKIAELKKTQNN